MSGCLEQRWVSYAGEDGEAWKCILLSRALKRTLTTRPLVIICSEGVSRAMGRRLQEEVSQLWWVDPKEWERSGVSFHSHAKIVAERLQGLHKIVFLDNNVLPLKNCDKLFRTEGVQWVESQEGEPERAAILVKSRSMGKQDQELFTNLVMNRENPGRKGKIVHGAGLILEKIDYAVVVDMKGSHPSPLPGKDVRMVTFVNGHPNEVTPGFDKRGMLESQVYQLVSSLLPELHTPKLVNGHGPTTSCPSPTQGEVQESRCPSWELNNSIAIVGMACRYPCANTIAEFWDLLAAGKEGIRKVPAGRWTKDQAFIRMDNMSATEAGFLSCPIHTFDAKFFNTNAADMHYLDPQQRLSLRVVWEALEAAGIDPQTLKGSLTGVFGGWWRNDYKEMLQMLGIVDTDFLRGYMGNALGPLTARISHFFELIGPSFSTESGCSTSVAGVDMACDSLRSDACDLAIAVGANLLLHPFSPTVMEGVLAPDGRCKTYDASADGFGRAEGIGVLILKRFGDAVADGDKIWGCIRGSAVVQEGPSKSMGTPTVDVEAKAMSLALERAGVDPDDVEFLETHGTGTPVGDPIEIMAVAKAYSGGTKGRSNILTIGSVKTNIGHTESVCGIAGIQKSVLSMAHELIPVHLHLKTINPDINLDAIPAQLPLTPMVWKRRPSGKPRIAGINSFGITGAQAHVIVQEPPLQDQLPPRDLLSHEKDSRVERILTFSAKSEEAFRIQVESYAKLLQDGKGISLNDLEFSNHIARPHMGLRAVVVGSTKEALLVGMEGIKGKSLPNQIPQLCFLFTGQGSQYPGMGAELYAQNLVFRSNFDWMLSLLEKEHGLVSLKEAMWGPNSKTLLKSSLYSQTAIFVLEFCLLRLWQSWGLVPSCVLGHSLGEFAAAVAAGLISPKDALTLVVARSKLISALPSSSMVVVGVGLEGTMTCLERAFPPGSKKWLDVAAVNSETQTVLSGPTSTVTEFKAYCDNNEVRTHVLESGHAFHSREMDPMLEAYSGVAGKLNFPRGEVGNPTFISSVDGGIVSQLDVGYWVRHTRERVRFLEASHTVVREGCGVFLELGPHPVLSALLSTNVDEIADVVAVPALRRSTPEWKTTLSTLGQLYGLGLSISWPDFHRYSSAKRIPGALPSYHFEETPYWMSIKEEGATPFHPLVGGALPNPSALSIFRSSINVQRLPFLKDHALGDKIIFPCVGYIDMCLTAAYAASLGPGTPYSPPSSPLCVRNFQIHSPIVLSELAPSEFQVVVDKGQGPDPLATIYTRVYLEDGSFKWVRHASASFSANPPPPSEIAREEFTSIKARCTELVRENFDYRELEEFGFNFGPSCRTVSPGCKNPEDGGEWLFPFKSHESVEDHARFIIHPWVTDPMLQTQIMALGLLHDTQVRKRLVVPVSVENFTWWAQNSETSPPTSGWIHVKHSAGGNEAHLYGEDGRRLVSMLGTEFMETTLANILSLIDSQKNPYPSLAELGWREKLGGEERRVPEKELGSLELKKVMERGDAQFTREEAEFHARFNKLAGLYMLKALKELGLEEKKAGHGFSWPQVTGEIGVIPSLSKFLRYILLEVGGDGWLAIKGQGSDSELTFTLSKPWPGLEVICAQITDLSATISSAGVGVKELISTQGVWDVLSKILSGSISALPLLFPEGGAIQDKGPAEICYTESLFAQQRYTLNSVETQILTSLAGMGSKSVVRILEVGAGVGSETQHLLPALVSAGTAHFHYTYTDLSPAFLAKGEEILGESGIASETALLDIEKDPSEQGFILGSYDVIVASWVLHATGRLDQVVGNLRQLLRPGGYLLLTELVEPTRAVKLLFGGLEGFWKFEDEEIRPWHCELSVVGWKTLLKLKGFQAEAISSYDGANALIVAKKGAVSAPRKDKFGANTWIFFGQEGKVSPLEARLAESEANIIKITPNQVPSRVEMEETLRSLLKAAFTDEGLNIRGLIYSWGLDSALSTSEICEPFLYIAKYLVKLQSNCRVVTLIRGNLSTGLSDYGLLPPKASPLIGMLQVLANENMDLSCKVIDLDPASPSDLDAWSELWSQDVDVLVAFRAHSRLIPRLRAYKVKSSPLPIPTSPRYRLLLPPSHLIADLTFTPCEREEVAPLECEVEVKAYALNFLDVLMVTKPDPVFEKYNYLGVDIAGVVTAAGAGCQRKVGDRVVIVRRSGPAMPSHIISPDHRTLVIPDDITFSEAATFPMGLLTVATCLVDVAKAGPDDTVLIHTASGGVGLIGTQIAKRLGCRVVVTAGNERKRSYLRDQYGVEHVFNSRTTEYEADIRRALGGKGVTVVMNSLTSPGFKEATLNLCEKGARFVEMSKMNIWSKEDVARLRPDVSYEVVDVSTLSDEKLNELAVYLQGQLLRRKEDRPSPLPYTRFDAGEIREALEYMEKVKHVGKIVLKMPDLVDGAQVTRLLNPASTYMITGGLGGIGLEVASWMASQGADTLLLLGRSEPKGDAVDKVTKLRELGIRVETRALDIGSMTDLENLLKEFSSGVLPPLRGIMHAAGILDDGMYENQSWEKYEAVFQAKVTGAWNLHRISLSLPTPLEHFVLFSSMTATVGAVAQSNYVAGNQYLDSLAGYRVSLGLPANCINWGQWGGVGLAAHLNVALNKPLSIHQGTAALGHALTCHARTQLMAHESDLPAYKGYLPSCRGLLADFEEDTGPGGTEIDGDEFWREYDATSASGGREEKVGVLRKFLKRLIRLTLKMDRNEEIGDHVAFQDLGMDSLMMVEMKNGLQASVGKRVKISINAVKDCKTVAQLGDRLVELISGTEELPPPSPEELKALVAKDAALSPSIVVDATLKATLVRPITAIKTVLVLGSTGTLGPYIVRELLARAHITRIVCIMQANPMISPTERWRRVYEKKGLLPSEADMTRIECLVGDVKEPLFGLVDPIYRSLAGEVDVVVNLSVKVAFEEIYRASEDPKSSRINNVTGMRNVLQFAVDGKKLKYVYHASTFAAETRLDDSGHFWEGWPAEEEVARFPNSAYSISKLICDRLAEQAVEAGVPCKVFRLPQLGGDSVRGGNVQMESFLMMRFLAYLYTGRMHGASVPLSLMAVDQCAQLSVELFFKEEAGFEMFNVLNPHLGDEREFETLAREFGVAVKVMESTEFLEKWNAMDSKDEMIQLVKFATSKDAVLLHLRDQEFPFYAAFKEGNKNIFFSKKLSKLIPNKYPETIVPSWEVLRRDLRFARDSGVFERFKIKHSNPYFLTS